MALDTFANLKAAITDHANSTNVTDAVASDFILLAEAELTRRIAARRKTIRSNATVTAEFVDLPDDFESVVALDVTSPDPNRPLSFVSPVDAVGLRSSLYTAAGVPSHYTIVGNELHIVPIPDASYVFQLTYRRRIPALADGPTAAVPYTSNWVLTSHPDLYLYGSLIHAGPYLIGDERISVWGTLHERALLSLERQDSISQFGGRLNARPSRAFG